MKIYKNDLYCPLCQTPGATPFHTDENRSYFQCSHCLLVFVPEQFWISPTEEKAVYDLHDNHADDPGYQQFLSRLSQPLTQRLMPLSKGLDFGCGPGPALPAMLKALGHEVECFDPYYCNQKEVFNTRYDFICATEVAEHLKEPGKEFSRLFKILKPNGWMGFMTKLVIDKNAFKNWHYIRDNTHICFYSKTTFEYMAARFKARLEIIGSDVILLNKN